VTARGIDPSVELWYAADALSGDFQLFEEIGRGATAVVYRARERRGGRDVALKVVRLTHADDRESVARLVNEARTVSRLAHPNVVSLYDVRALHGDRIALVVQLVRGGTLRAALRRSAQFPIMYVERIVRDIAAALAHAHANGVVHRDVKPENIFLDADTGRAMLADFGAAHAIDHDGAFATGAAGTPTYMAPEQIDGHAVDARSDLYSLGLIAWEMITGERPWMGEELYAILHKQKTEELPPMDALRPDVPERLQYMVERLMAKRIDDRWPSAEAFLRAWNDATPKEGWRRWRVARRERSEAWTSARAEFHGDVDRLAKQLGQLGADDDLPTLERLDRAPSKRRARRNRSRIAGGAMLAIAAAAGVTVAVRVAQRVRATADTPFPAADRRAFEVPVIPPASDSLARADSLARTDSLVADSARALAARLDSVHAARAALPPFDSLSRRARAARDTSRGDLADADIATVAASVAPRSVTPQPRTMAPVDDVPPAPPVRAVSRPGVDASALVAAGGRHSCAVSDDGIVICWGANEAGQLGDGTLASHALPIPVNASFRATLVTNGTEHSCALSASGEAYCWGANDRGQLGDGTTTRRIAPARVPTTWRFRALHAGATHTCGLTVDGEVACWGSNSYGQLGGGASGMVTTPLLVSALRSRVAALAVGWQHSCAIDADAALWCWGRNTSGQLGDGTTVDRHAPVRIGGSMRFIAVAAGGTHSCAVSDDGGVWCWGKNSSGQLGTGATEDALAPVRVDVPGSFVAVTTGASHTCARMRGGSLYCWGRNVYGQLGDGSTVDRARPVPVSIAGPVVAVQASAAHTCALTADGGRFCWGYNAEGQLGDGTRDNRARPTRVAREESLH
jgi:alpha-tubulin suppressor-like RCC1 family protein/serine/threonine protein kinase